MISSVISEQLCQLGAFFLQVVADPVQEFVRCRFRKQGKHVVECRPSQPRALWSVVRTIRSARLRGTALRLARIRENRRGLTDAAAEKGTGVRLCRSRDGSPEAFIRRQANAPSGRPRTSIAIASNKFR